MTSTMLVLTDAAGQQSALRLMTKDPWRAHGAELTSREQTALQELAATHVPAPTSIALDTRGSVAGVGAHLMSRLPGAAVEHLSSTAVASMTDTLATIHAVNPIVPFRPFQSWAWEAKWVVPQWTTHPESWQRAFALLAEESPSYEPTFLHRDFSHRNHRPPERG